MKKIDRKFLYICLSIGGMVFLSVFYVSLWNVQLKTPKIYRHADYMAFYAAGDIAKTGTLSALYDLEQQHAVQERVSDRTLDLEEIYPYIHPPFIVPVLGVITDENYVASFSRWGIVLLIFNALVTYILSKNLQYERSWEGILFFVAVLLFYPSFMGILKGQDTGILLLGVSIWMIGFLRGKDKVAGLALSLVTLRPHIALVLAIPFLFNRRNVFKWFVVGASVLTFFSIALIGFEGTFDYIELLRISSRGDGFQLRPDAMFNLVGIFARSSFTISHKSLEMVGWLGFGLVILGLSFFWAKSKEITEKHLSIAIILGILSAPHLHYHDLSLLILPLIVLFQWALSHGHMEMSLGIFSLVGLSVLLVFNHYLPSIYLLPYLLMIAMLFFFIWHSLPYLDRSQKR